MLGRAGRRVVVDDDAEPRNGPPDARSSDRRRPSTLRLSDQRVRDLIVQARAKMPTALIDALRTAVRAFFDGGFSDDLCLLAARARK